MTLKSQPFVVVVVVLLLNTLMPLFVSAKMGGQAAPPTGGWQPISNVTDPEVQEVAKFAVTEHNKESGATLEYQIVDSGETQVVSGTNYNLVIEAKDGAETNKYQAIVWVKPWMHFQKLMAFVKL